MTQVPGVERVLKERSGVHGAGHCRTPQSGVVMRGDEHVPNVLPVLFVFSFCDRSVVLPDPGLFRKPRLLLLDCMLHYSVKTTIMKNLKLPVPDVSKIPLPAHLSADDVKVNARIRYLPDESGVFRPYELLVFSKRTFLPSGWEASSRYGSHKRDDDINALFDAVEASEISQKENRRKSFNRARNNLFNYSMSTTAFNCFVTLTFDAQKIDRFDYKAIIAALNTWLDNRVRRKGLVYVLVPEYHKNGAIHFHGLCNFEALKTVRANSPYSGKPLYDTKGRPKYNISDFPLGHTVVIPLSGENARVATTKYVYKYITKSEGKMIGGRYYLSGGDLGRPKYRLLNLNYSDVPGAVIKVGGIVELKKYRFNSGETEYDLFKAMREVSREQS